MKFLPTFLVLLTILVGLLVMLSQRIQSRFVYPYPPITQLVWDVSADFESQSTGKRPLGVQGGFRDLSGLFLGMRRMVADIAWVGVLQYYGGGGGHHHETLETHGSDPSLKKLVMRVIKLDPDFYFAYLYGAGSLAFNLNRYDEALEILEEGLKAHPKYWKFGLYTAAIVWKKKGEYEKFIPLLEKAITYSDCPTLIKSSLANIYKANKNYTRALEIWIGVLEQENLDETYTHQATLQIADLRARLGL